MKKLQALHQFIVDLNLVADNDVDSYVDKLEVIPAGRPSLDDPAQIILSTCKYSANFYISGYPFNRHPVELLVGQLSAWLLEYDDRRLDSNQFSVNVDVFDENGNVADVANLEIELELDEIVTITRDDGGTILFNNLSYSLS
jgi:hypothetical protein